VDCNKGNRGVNFVNTKPVKLLGWKFRCTIQEELEAPCWRSEDTGRGSRTLQMGEISGRLCSLIFTEAQPNPFSMKAYTNHVIIRWLA